MQILNDPRPWYATLRGTPLNVSDLVARETLTPQSAAILWWTIRRGASVFVAAGPPGAGKSTVANALLEYLPDDAQVYVTAGAWDQLELPRDAAGPIYLLVNELSAHMPVYLCGPAAQEAVLLSKSGVRLFGTLHARSAAEAMRVLCYESDVSRDDVRGPLVFVVISAGWQGQQIVRRVVEIGFLSPACELTPLLDSGRLHPDGATVLANWQDLSPADVEAQIAQQPV